ncbi:hypothetical protein ACNSOS_04505 [Aliarcobacter vitoriensis]|uniref:hypothetical protein n=1 Tax=Aliarcobacter vitoriensis TaxID=2011099 RepID=UPI003AAE4FF8
MTTDIKLDEIIVLKNNEEREKIIAKNREFIIDTYPDMKLKDIPNRFEFITNNNDFPDEVYNDIDFMFVKMNSASFKFSEPFVYLPDRRLINAIDPITCGLMDGLLFICDTMKDKEYPTGYLFIRYYKNKLYLIDHFLDLTRSSVLFMEFYRFAKDNYRRNLAILVDEFYNL